MFRPYTLLPLIWMVACKDPSDKDSTTDDSSPTDDSTPTDDSSATGYNPPDNAWYHGNTDEVTVPENGSWERGESPPDLHLIDQNGDEVWLYQFIGRPVFIDFFGEWCGPCGVDAPYLQRFWEEHQHEAVMLGVAETDRNFDPGDADTVARWVEAYGLTHPVGYAPGDAYEDIPELNAWPTIMMLDPKMRVAQTAVNQLEDGWISQFIERMAFMIGGDLDTPEVCGDGIDNDLNAMADCMESACAAECAEQVFTGSTSPCTPGETVTVDLYRVTIPAEVVTLSADTVSAATTYDLVLRAIPEGGDWVNSITVGDDEFPCTYPPTSTACPEGWLRPGTWILGVMPANGGSNTGQCANPELAEYVLTINGNATVELIQDDYTLPSYSGN